MKRLISLVLFLILVGGCHGRTRIVPAGGLQDFGDGTFGAAVRNAEDIQTILLINNCGLTEPCQFQWIGLSFKGVLKGTLPVYFAINKQRNLDDFMTILGCQRVFVCSVDNENLVTITAQRKRE